MVDCLWHAKASHEEFFSGLLTGMAPTKAPVGAGVNINESEDGNYKNNPAAVNH
jgi:hypothetical protein